MIIANHVLHGWHPINVEMTLCRRLRERWFVPWEGACLEQDIFSSMCKWIPHPTQMIKWYVVLIILIYTVIFICIHSSHYRIWSSNLEDSLIVAFLVLDNPGRSQGEGITSFGHVSEGLQVPKNTPKSHAMQGYHPWWFRQLCSYHSLFSQTVFSLMS